MVRKRMSHTHATIGQIKAIPADRMATKVKRTLTGLFILALCVGATWQFEAPWYVAVSGGVVAATIWSGELVLTPIKLLAAIAKDLMTKSEETPEP